MSVFEINKADVEESHELSTRAATAWLERKEGSTRARGTTERGLKKMRIESRVLEDKSGIADAPDSSGKVRTHAHCVAFPL